MSDETNFNRIKNIDRRLIKREQAEEINEVLVRVDGIDYELPRRLARADIARVFANSDGRLDSKAIDEMLGSTEDAEELAVAIIKSLGSEAARKLNKTLNNADVVTDIEDRTEANRELSKRERDERLERRKTLKQRRRERREESQPDVGGVYNVEYDDVDEV